MGRFQKVSAVDHDEEEVDGNDFGQEHWRPAGMCCGCLTPKEALALFITAVLFGFIALSAASFVVNAVVRHSLALVATGSLGARIAIGAVSIGVFSSQSMVSDIQIDSPPGFGRQGAFVTMQKFVFDMPLQGVTADTWHFQELKLSYITVNIEQQPDFYSNANFVVSHLLNASGGAIVAGFGPLPSRRGARRSADGALGSPRLAEGELQEEEREREEVSHARLVGRKFVVDKLEFHNIEVSVCIHPACDEVSPVTFTIRRVVVKDVGKQHDGIHLDTLIHVIMQALLAAVLQAAPGNVGGQLHRSFGESIKLMLDYAKPQMDVGGGLQELHDWNRWQPGVLGVASPVTGAGIVQAGAAHEPQSWVKSEKEEFTDLGLGCCTESHQHRIFAGYIGGVAKCMEKCMEFSTCGYAITGWEHSSDWCIVLSNRAPCSSLESGSDFCGGPTDNGAHSYKLKALDNATAKLAAAAAITQGSRIEPVPGGDVVKES